MSYEEQSKINEAEFYKAFPELEKLFKDNGWLPLETAPTDATYILLYNDLYRDSKINVGANYGGYWSTFYNENGNHIDPTHWMPLPLPPQK